MAELTTVARPYAKAAFQFADENGALAEWSAMLKFLAAVTQQDTVAQFIDNPKITSTRKAEGFLALCADKLNPAGTNFVSLLAQNKRLSALSEISVLFEVMKSEKERSVDALITSAFPLTSEQTSKLADSLTKKLGREVNVTTAIDNTILGGVVIKAGDLVIDGSVRGKLAKLAETLNS